MRRSFLFCANWCRFKESFPQELDKKNSGAGIMGSVAVLFVCFLLWQIFDLGADDGFRPDKPKD